jgi:hypothetical protein
MRARGAANDMKNKKNREMRRINPFDVIIVILIVCLLFTFAYRIYVGVADETHKNEIKYVMKFECEEEYNSLLDHLSEGDAVYFADGKLFGYLYAAEDSEDGAVYAIIDDIPTFAGDGELDLPSLNIGEEIDSGEESAVETESTVEDGSETESKTESETESAGESAETVEEQKAGSDIYKKIKLGGTIRLNIEAVRVKSGNYYSIGGTNFVEGSVIEVYTDRAVFTIKVINIDIVEE